MFATPCQDPFTWLIRLMEEAGVGKLECFVALVGGIGGPPE